MYSTLSQLHQKSGSSKNKRYSEDVDLSLYDWENVRPESNPSIWGPSFWYTLHNSALQFPIDPTPFASQTMLNFILALPWILPCSNCSEHAKQFLSAYPDLREAVSSRDNIFKFFWDFHNHVNVNTGKKPITFSDAFTKYAK